MAPQIAITDEQWHTTTGNEIMQEAQAEAMLEQATRRLGLMVLCMTGGVEYDELVQTIEYEDDIEDRNFWAGGQW